MSYGDVYQFRGGPQVMVIGPSEKEWINVVVVRGKLMNDTPVGGIARIDGPDLKTKWRKLDT